MKTYKIEDKAYKCPMYVVRAGNGWQLRAPNKASVFYGDLHYGGIKKSHLAVLQAWRDEGLPPNLSHLVRTSESPLKTRPTGVVGIYLMYSPKRGKRMASYSFHISKPGSRERKTVYIGTEKTWESKYDERFEKAKTIREEALAEIVKQSQRIV